MHRLSFRLQEVYSARQKIPNLVDMKMSTQQYFINRNSPASCHVVSSADDTSFRELLKKKNNFILLFAIKVVYDYFRKTGT